MSNKKLTYLLIGLVVVQLIVVGMTMVAGRTRGTSGGGSGDDNFFFPVWVAIFLPVIVSRRKKKISEEGKRRALVFALGLGVVVLLMMIAFLLRLSS